MSTSISNLLSSGTGTGLGQGIDVQQFVQLALAGDHANITALQNQQTALASQTTALTQITTDLNTRQSAAFALNDPLGSLNAQSATSSNSGVLTATAAGTAVAGTHSITVNSLATTSSYYTNAVATSSTTLAAGSFKVSVGSNALVTLTIDSTNNTLDKLAAAINTQNVGVQASVINDVNGSRLALVSQTTGAPGDVAVSSNTTGLTFTKAVSLTTPALSRVFSLLYYQIRPHFSVGARTASFSAAAVSLCHPNLLSPFTIINSVWPTKHLFDHIDHDELFELPIPQGRRVA